MQADQAQYFYDELGRLVGVVDGNGDAAVYTYDEVGNLLSIERFTVGATGIEIFLLAPASGSIGAQMEIRGFGFSSVPVENTVEFNGTAATVSSSAATTIVTTVPSGATTGPVTVTNTNGTAISPQPFTVLVTTITGIEPNPVAQGSSNFTIISGTNLAGATDVQFTESGLSATLIGGASGESLPITLSVSSTVPPADYDFSVTTAEGVVQSGAVTITVAPAEASQGVAPVVSVFRPFPGGVASPSGNSQAVVPPVSVSKP